jgi:colicin import membrane protein
MTVEALKRIPGVGPSTAAALHQAGFTDVEAVAHAQLDELTAVPGIGGARAERLRAAAQNLVTMDGSADVAADRDGPLAAPSLESVAAADTGSAEIVGNKKKKKKKKKKRRTAARAKLDEEISALQSRLGELDAKADKARRRVKKAGSKKQRVRRREELDRLKRKVKKLRKRIDRLHRARADDNG